MNFVFKLLNQNIPTFLIKILINKYVIFLFDRPSINKFLFGIMAFLRKFREKRRKSR